MPGQDPHRSADQQAAIAVDHVSCTYGDFVAVDDVSLQVAPGEIHALLGTNGAGKTTLLETIQGFRRPASGSIAVFGMAPGKHRTHLAARTGTMLQESGLVDEMTVSDQLSLWQKLNLREDSVGRVLSLVGLDHRRKVSVATLSGGERRRLDFAMAMWGNPELVVLDEPTTGLDPQSRRSMWAIIQELNSRGSTVLLTTHYLDEAQSLASRVTMLDRGRIAIEGSMADVLSAIPAQIAFEVDTSALASLNALEGHLAGKVTTDDSAATGESSGTAITIHTPNLQDDVGVVIDWARAHSATLERLTCAPASLEEVFFDISSRDTRKAAR